MKMNYTNVHMATALGTKLFFIFLCRKMSGHQGHAYPPGQGPPPPHPSQSAYPPNMV